jgi:hypothetical protein
MPLAVQQDEAVTRYVREQTDRDAEALEANSGLASLRYFRRGQ